MQYLLMALVICITVGIYFYYFFKRFFTLFRLADKPKLTKRCSLLLALVCAAGCVWILGLGAVLVLHFLAVCLIMDLLNLLLKHKMKSEKVEKCWSFLYRSGLIGVLVVALVVGYGFYNIRQVHRTEYTLETVKPLGQELKIVQISDLHMGTVMDMSKLREYCGKIQQENPDILALTGDIFDERTSREEMEETAKLLGEIKTTYGIYYVFGNHDYNYYSMTPLYTPDELRSVLTENGIQVLEDDVVEVSNNLTIVGRKDASVERREMSELISGVNKDAFVLLLEHQPVNLTENASLGVDLQLSGHTHAGQIWPTGQLNQLIGAVELNYGWKKIDDFQVIVSSGIAGWGYPIRTGGHSEYVVITVSEH